MTVTGLEHSRYFLFNPIWVDITDAPRKVSINVKIEGESNRFELYSYDRKIRFDIGKLILGLIKNVTNKTNLIGSMDGAYRVDMIIENALSGQKSKFQQLKYFILGGIKGYGHNIPAPINLSLTNYVWNGYPKWKSILTTGVVNQLGQPEDYINLRPKLNCNNIFFAFRNHLGGFSPYLFEDYNVNDDNKNKGYYLTQREIKTSGVDASLSVTVRGQVHRRFYDTIRSLADSFEIYIYNDNIIKLDDEWIRVNGNNNNVSFNPKNIATDVEMNFDVITNLNKVW